MNVILYSTGCPQCKVLEKKLQDSGLQFEISDDVDSMINKGFTSAPVLGVNNQYMTFKEALDWLRNRER